MVTTHLDDDFAVVCANGHLINRYSVQRPDSRSFCPQCGARAIKECPACNAPIEAEADQVFEPRAHQHCSRCGSAMPWSRTIAKPAAAVDPPSAGTGGEGSVLGDPSPRGEIRIFVSSPGDLKEERRLVAEVCRELTSALGMRLRALLWEGGGPRNPEVPPFPPDVTGHAAQAVLDRYVWDSLGGYDVYLGMIWKRMGTPTGASRSGTEAEFRYALGSHRNAGRPRKIMFYQKLPRPGDQLDSGVGQFVDELKKLGLVQPFANRSDLRRMLVDHLSAEAHNAMNGQPIARAGKASVVRTSAPNPSTRPSIIFDLRYHGAARKLELANDGIEPVFDVTFEFPPDAAPVAFQGGLPIHEIPPGRSVNVTAIRLLSSGGANRTSFHVHVRGRTADDRQVEQDAFLDLLE
jgi:hypothetical protein